MRGRKRDTRTRMRPRTGKKRQCGAAGPDPIRPYVPHAQFWRVNGRLNQDSSRMLYPHDPLALDSEASFATASTDRIRFTVGSDVWKVPRSFWWRRLFCAAGRRHRDEIIGKGTCHALSQLITVLAEQAYAPPSTWVSAVVTDSDPTFLLQKGITDPIRARRIWNTILLCNGLSHRFLTAAKTAQLVEAGTDSAATIVTALSLVFRNLDRWRGGRREAIRVMGALIKGGAAGRKLSPYHASAFSLEDDDVLDDLLSSGCVQLGRGFPILSPSLPADPPHDGYDTPRAVAERARAAKLMEAGAELLGGTSPRWPGTVT
ncbi:unnamed protein product [Vitrella brassicaformis CCMP3155]|uniref:Uncharacterized protein n=1 Tax=Vitrella brassicaformis (strain CCMP3155) TaxID=1169540 RepID=A0A0G4GST8_VITBC|nr:unnamed protein product [Vitrella brassicaformis CCMP3155]|eukprot:CEM33764.1 unnamed protein product [Vitrella brassicaformis CCMP3155]